MEFETMPALTRDGLCIKVTAIFEWRTTLTIQLSQFCVDLNTLAYKNANLFATAIIWVIFDWQLCKLLTTGLVNNAMYHKIFLEAQHSDTSPNKQASMLPIETIKQTAF